MDSTKSILKALAIVIFIINALQNLWLRSNNIYSQVRRFALFMLIQFYLTVMYGYSDIGGLYNLITGGRRKKY